MPCVCGQKVDRNQPKVLCAQCKEYFHLNCVGILPADLDFLITADKPFFCKVCSAERRNSNRSFSPSNLFAEKAVANSASSDTQKNKTIGMTNDSANKQQVTLLTIAKEIGALRSENARMLSLLNTLREDKQQLLQKFDALQAETVSMHTKLASSEANISLIKSELINLREIVSSVINNKGAISKDNTACSLPAVSAGLSSRAAFSSLSAASIAHDAVFVSRSATITGTESAMMGSNSAAAITMCASGSRSSLSACSPVSAPSSASVAVPSSESRPTAATSASSFSPSPLITSFPIVAPLTTNSSPLPAANTNVVGVLTTLSSAAISSTSPPALLLSSQSAVSAGTAISTAININTSSYADVAAHIPASLTMSPVKNANASMSNVGKSPVWKSVPKNNRRKLKQPLIIGSSNNNELSVVPKMRWLHLSPFSSSVTADNLKDYIAKHTGIEENSIFCYSLIKKGVQPTSLKSVNFKVGVNANCYSKLLVPELWPTNVVVRPFSFLPKNDVMQLMSNGNQSGQVVNVTA